jgi:hypothetical protein
MECKVTCFVPMQCTQSPVIPACSDLACSSLETHGGLFDTTVHVHVGKDSEAPCGSHAMAVVGWRKDAVSGDLRLLVQNWWRGKQFFEVDLQYLVSRKAQLSWITTVSGSSATSALVPKYSMVASVAAESRVTGVDTGLREVDLGPWLPGVPTGPRCHHH